MVKFPRSIHAWTVALVVGAGSAVAGVPAGAMEVPLRTIAVGLSEDVTRIDAQFDDSATISGRITGPDGKPVRDAQVNALRRVDDDPDGAFKGVADATTDAEGRYTLHELQAGHYRLYISDSDGHLASEWYGNGAHLHDGPVTTLGVGEELTGVDVEMALAARISGRITNTGGRMTYVIALIPMEQRPSGWGGVGGREVSEDGTYVVGGLPAGTYRIEFDHTGDRQDEYWDNERSVEDARSLTVTAGVMTRGINARLDQFALHRVRAPRVTGKAKVGRTLKVSKGVWEPRKVTVKYQWFVKDGKKFVAVKKATKASLKLTRAMGGKKVRVRVRVSTRGYRPEVFTSRASATITR